MGQIPPNEGYGRPHGRQKWLLQTKLGETCSIHLKIVILFVCCKSEEKILRLYPGFVRFYVNCDAFSFFKKSPRMRFKLPANSVGEGGYAQTTDHAQNEHFENRNRAFQFSRLKTKCVPYSWLCAMRKVHSNTHTHTFVESQWIE